MSPRRAAVLRDGGGELSLRDHLVAAAERLVAERGAAGLTVRDIAREAQVAAGVLYNHFADKEELLALGLHAHVRAAERARGPLPVAGTATVAENLRAILLHGIELHREILPAFAGLAARPKVLERFAALPNPLADGRGLRAGIADYLRAELRLGRVAAEARPDAVAVMLVGACHELVFPPPAPMPDAPPPEVAPEVVDDLVAAVLDGLRPR
ncbi:TetR/AcrR family transcriptional regulator [Streptomonospora nanhaiensis]|uniref:AcrR family transcriptional regulator n=1 Tax=Streptomonospora nanhaiensis TaxID=1323731 RepID=A0A853BQ41_9ACTN|nr:TetR family transcriptional regulator [Streptomonospora nanhaiensis]MBV2363428.1 TetR/AcrR family transcriptional regulator [Streptomonospora nanhaiensis]MBX9387662.1 TetR/AcrR family transcriptional regulator [Streptomonospora nanhaiensis]NYI96914.1 AcrR family transcriptional regulator [Streptomonospora nanhaiensis]